MTSRSTTVCMTSHGFLASSCTRATDVSSWRQGCDDRKEGYRCGEAGQESGPPLGCRLAGPDPNQQGQFLEREGFRLRTLPKLDLDYPQSRTMAAKPDPPPGILTFKAYAISLCRPYLHSYQSSTRRGCTTCILVSRSQKEGSHCSSENCAMKC